MDSRIHYIEQSMVIELEGDLKINLYFAYTENNA